MHDNLVEPVTLWTAFRTIKSSARCSLTKQPLPRSEYMELTKVFGLTPEQRNAVYDLYIRYEEWLEHGSYKWDEADRVLYILRHVQAYSQSTVSYPGRGERIILVRSSC